MWAILSKYFCPLFTLIFFPISKDCVLEGRRENLWASPKSLIFSTLNQKHHFLSTCQFGQHLLVLRLRFLSFFFFFFFFSAAMVDPFFCEQCTCALFTDPQTPFLSTFSLKMGPTALFTHLKIILLQCFQFSVFSFSKISSIQTYPTFLSFIFHPPKDHSNQTQPQGITFSS